MYYDVARKRIQELKIMYLRLAQTEAKDGTWDWWIKNEIKEIESDLQRKEGA